jgi:hypothetical protein
MRVAGSEDVPGRTAAGAATGSRNRIEAVRAARHNGWL